MNRIGLITELDTEVKKLNGKEYLRYLQYKLIGIAFEFISEEMLKEEILGFPIIVQAMANLKDDSTINREILTLFTKKIVMEFLGQMDSSEGVNEISKKAKWTMNNIQLCDLCYFKEFTCQYEQNFYLLDKDYSHIFRRKIKLYLYPYSSSIKILF